MPPSRETLEASSASLLVDGLAGDGLPQERILQAAAELFSRKGFANVSIREICQQARASLPMIYYYFHSKEGLFEAVVERLLSMEPFIQQLEAAIAGREGVQERLRSFIEVYLSAYPLEAVRVGWYVRGSAELDGYAVERYLTHQQRIQKLAAALVRQGTREGRFEPIEEAYAATCLLGMLNTFVMRRAHFRERFDTAQAGAFVYRFFLRAVGAREPSIGEGEPSIGEPSIEEEPT